MNILVLVKVSFKEIKSLSDQNNTNIFFISHKVASVMLFLKTFLDLFCFPDILKIIKHNLCETTTKKHIHYFSFKYIYLHNLTQHAQIFDYPLINVNLRPFIFPRQSMVNAQSPLKIFLLPRVVETHSRQLVFKVKFSIKILQPYPL